MDIEPLTLRAGFTLAENPLKAERGEGNRKQIMKRIFIFFVILAFSVGGISLVSYAKNGPRLSIKDKNVDFGIQDIQDELEKTILIKNAGGESLLIRSVEADCGCTAALLSSQIVPPKGEASLLVKIQVKDFQGDFSKNVTLHTNDPEALSFTITVSGTMKRIFAFDTKILDFNVVHAGKGATLSFAIQRVTEEKVKIKGIEAAPSYLRIEDVHSPDGIFTFIKVSLSEKTPPGDFKGSVRIKTSSKIIPEYTIPVRAKVLP